MPVYTFTGEVLSAGLRLTTDSLEVDFEGDQDQPGGHLRVQVVNNRVIARFTASAPLSDTGVATVRNMVRSVASSASDLWALPEGAWTVVTVDTCVEEGSWIRTVFTNSQHLKREFADHGLDGERLKAVTLGPDGYWMRLALADMNAALLEPKFARSHLYRAVECLRNAVASVQGREDTSESTKWERLRDVLGIERGEIELLRHHPERHGDFGNAHPLTSAEMDHILTTIVRILAKYAAWYLDQDA